MAPTPPPPKTPLRPSRYHGPEVGDHHHHQESNARLLEKFAQEVASSRPGPSLEPSVARVTHVRAEKVTAEGELLMEVTGEGMAPGEYRWVAPESYYAPEANFEYLQRSRGAVEENAAHQDSTQLTYAQYSCESSLIDQSQIMPRRIISECFHSGRQLRCYLIQDLNSDRMLLVEKTFMDSDFPELVAEFVSRQFVSGQQSATQRSGVGGGDGGGGASTSQIVRVRVPKRKLTES